MISNDVTEAYTYTMKALETARLHSKTFEHIRKLVTGEVHGDRFVRRILGQTFGLNLLESATPRINQAG